MDPNALLKSCSQHLLFILPIVTSGEQMQSTCEQNGKGGAFYFMEHVAADRSTWTYFWQQVCDPTWRYIGDGCSLLKETWKDLENVGFSKLNLQHIIGPLFLSIVRPHIYGYAVK
ncbi:hypothetical protein E2320_016123 [Naja naja]|nr:hypothetical protein E2320_016123 [Naja naja]